MFWIASSPCIFLFYSYWCESFFAKLVKAPTPSLVSAWPCLSASLPAHFSPISFVAELAALLALLPLFPVLSFVDGLPQPLVHSCFQGSPVVMYSLVLWFLIQALISCGGAWSVLQLDQVYVYGRKRIEMYHRKRPQGNEDEINNEDRSSYIASYKLQSLLLLYWGSCTNLGLRFLSRFLLVWADSCRCSLALYIVCRAAL